MIINNKKFKTFIEFEKIQDRIKQLAENINKDYFDLNPLFLAILDGSFIFAAELYKNISINSEISFVKIKSYQGCESKDILSQIGLGIEVENRHIVILEDIVETGKTISFISSELYKNQIASLKIASLLSKPDKHNLKVDYVGFEITDQFVVGFGLDYDGLGRNIKDIAQMCS